MEQRVSFGRCLAGGGRGCLSDTIRRYENEGRVYPVVFRIGIFEVTGFGVLVAFAALVGLWLFRRELQRSDCRRRDSTPRMAGIIGGMAGAKLLWVFEHLGEEPAIIF